PHGAQVEDVQPLAAVVEHARGRGDVLVLRDLRRDARDGALEDRLERLRVLHAEDDGELRVEAAGLGEAGPVDELDGEGLERVPPSSLTFSRIFGTLACTNAAIASPPTRWRAAWKATDEASEPEISSEGDFAAASSHAASVERRMAEPAGVAETTGGSPADFR